MSRFLMIVMAVTWLATPAGAQPKPAEEPVPTLAPVVVPGMPIIVPDRTATTEEARQEIQRTVPVEISYRGRGPLGVIGIGGGPSRVLRRRPERLPQRSARSESDKRDGDE